ncbi:unnamed protein product [Moneuplotes crassus]|uniref:Uncharacterized protein n=1 Tax=Euplotes crassus TaxID=5936 RepID=A0AAD1Y4X3_EUPCR|nr:unnamed protein product [Moneuplotes crassus]
MALLLDTMRLRFLVEMKTSTIPTSMKTKRCTSVWLLHKFLAKMKYGRKMENEKFHQEIISNLNTIDQKLLRDAQRSKRDALALKAEIDELRMIVANQGEKELNVGEIQKEIDTFNTQNSRRILEAETKHMKNIANLNEDMNERMNALQDQITSIAKDFTRPKLSNRPNKAVEAALAEALDRISYLEEKIDGIKQPKRNTDNTLSLKAIKDELLQNLDERNDIIEENKQGLEKRLKHIERRLATENQDQRQVILDLRSEMEMMAGSKDPVFDTRDIDKRMKMLDQRHRRDIQEIQDELVELIDQKFVIAQKEKSSKLDRIIREINETNSRIDIHEDDMAEMTKVIQELDKDRIQDGKSTDILMQKYELLDERIENLSEAMIEINNIISRNSKMQLDHNDLNVIKEACLQDFNTLNERINEVAELAENIDSQLERNEKEMEAIRLVKKPRVNLIRKDISSPLRSSMSQHLGNNLHKRRDESQGDGSRYESIQRLTDQDTFMKADSRPIPDRESVLSGSKINKYLGDSFEDGHGSSFNNDPDRVLAFKTRSRDDSREKDTMGNFQSLNKKVKKPHHEEQVIVEDLDSYEERSEDRNIFSSQKKQLSREQSELTFKGDEIMNDKTDNNSNQKNFSDNRVTSLQRIGEEGGRSAERIYNLKSQKDNNIWGESPPNQKNSNMFISENKNPTKSFTFAEPKREAQEAIQLGPIDGNTLDEESSEGEEFESDLSFEDNEYLKGRIVQKHEDLKKDSSRKSNKKGKEFDDSWD